MITTIISIYSIGTLLLNDLPSVDQNWQTVPLENNQNVSSFNKEIPNKKAGNLEPVIKAKSAIAVDLQNGLVLYQKNINSKLPIASLTKLMTATIVLEENNLNDVVTVSKKAANTEGSKVWLAPDEKITVSNLLYSMLINSANDAAAALAEYNGKTQKEFVEKMNQKASELGMNSTFYNNPTGLDEDAPTTLPIQTTTPQTSLEDSILSTKKDKAISDNNNSTTQSEDDQDSSTESTKKEDQPNRKTDSKKVANQDPITIIPNLINQIENPEETESAISQNNYSTAYDLTILSRYAYNKSFVRQAAVQKEMEVSSVNGKITHKLKATNELLNSYLKVLGLKTGTTDEAGECLIAIIENEDHHKILTVMLNSKDRYKETKVLADWVFRTYTWQKQS